MWRRWKRQDVHGDRDKTEYNVYAFSWKETVLCVLKGMAVTALFSYVFYRSWFGFFALPVAVYLGMKEEREDRIRERKARLAIQFKDAVLTASSSMQAGHSVENAFLEAEREICSLYGRDSEMARELSLIRKGLKNQFPLERMLLNLGERSHVEEIRDFSEVFAVAKRLGGNLKEIIRRTSELTSQRMEVDREIQTILSAKKYEQKVMMLIPFLLFGYIQLTARGFFDILYHNGAGILVMTFCLMLYLAACVMARRLLDIQV